MRNSYPLMLDCTKKSCRGKTRQLILSLTPRQSKLGTNTLAYLAGWQARKKKSLTPSVPGDNVIKLSSFFADDEAK
jgi:hypothetical protein